MSTTTIAGSGRHLRAHEAGWRDVLRIIHGHRRWFALGVLLTMAASVLGLVQPLLVRQIIHNAETGSTVWIWVAVLVILFVGQALVQVVVRCVLARTGEGIVLGIRLNVIDHLLRLRMREYEKHRLGDLISRTATDSAVLRRVIAEGCTDAVTGVVGLAGTVAVMIWLDWVLVLIIAALVATGAVIVGSVMRGIRVASLQSQRSVGEMTSELERALSAIRTVRASRAERRETERITARARSAYAASLRMARLDAVVGPATELAVNGAFLVVLLVGGMRVANGSTSVADLVAFLLYVTYLVGPISATFEAASALQQGTGALQRIDDVLDLPREPDATGDDLAAQEWSSSPSAYDDREAVPVLEFRDVWFAYDGRRPVLRGVSFRVPPQGQTALVGRSGVGKSTIFALAERFYDPDYGEILFCGRDVRSIRADEYRARIGLVEQHCPVLYGTLRENLLYVAPDADEHELQRAIELANLGELVSRLPHGLNTDVGEHGMVLSGGERQRVAIARSLLTRPTLLLLDEPTSQLDAVNETALRRAIKQVSAECALLVIAHRFSTIRGAHQVVVLDHGQVVAVGEHDRLLDTNDYYARLADLPG
jgi:ABC-type multidrug transport system fused ATPase/permease subunit